MINKFSQKKYKTKRKIKYIFISIYFFYKIQYLFNYYKIIPYYFKLKKKTFYCSQFLILKN